MGSVATDPTTGRNPEAIFGFLVAMMFAAWVFPMVAAAIKDGVTPIDFVGLLMLGGPHLLFRCINIAHSALSSSLKKKERWFWTQKVNKRFAYAHEG